DAATVAKLRKPTRAAWAVNQLARSDRSVLRKVLRAGERLRKAQERALKGGSGSALRKAGAEEREAVAAAVERAAELLGDQASGATLERVRSSLQAAARDESVRGEVEAGRLTADHEPVGLGAFEAAAAAPAPSRRVREKGPDAATRRRRRDAKVAAREANRRLDAARRELERRADAATRAQTRLKQAQADADAAASEAAKADAELEQALR
ncbi:MAG: hypothetical protein JW895_04660, partial [Thermoleophilaceae bacterium]|nr:hypothetical protein [Thermoleophilaceae bacterium]